MVSHWCGLSNRILDRMAHIWPSSCGNIGHRGLVANGSHKDTLESKETGGDTKWQRKAEAEE